MSVVLYGEEEFASGDSSETERKEEAEAEEDWKTKQKFFPNGALVASMASLILKPVFYVP